MADHSPSSGDAPSKTLTIGELSRRSGAATSALRYYEAEGLISSSRSSGNQRRYQRDTLRRVAFIRAAQQLGLSLEEIHASMASLPNHRVPTKEDWEKLARSWRPRLDQQIERLHRLRDELDGCIGCGCLSLQRCQLLNPSDRIGGQGPGPRFVIDGLDATARRAAKRQKGQLKKS